MLNFYIRVNRGKCVRTYMFQLIDLLMVAVLDKTCHELRLKA